MKLTAEMSLYPLHEDYIPIVQAFIDRLRAQADLEILTNATSTQVKGDYGRVFAVISEILAASAEQFGKQVLVVKFLPWDIELPA